MTPNDYDAVIIGGGPGGSSAATFLARAGKRVLALEKEILSPISHRRIAVARQSHPLPGNGCAAKTAGGRIFAEARSVLRVEQRFSRHTGSSSARAGSTANRRPFTSSARDSIMSCSSTPANPARTCAKAGAFRGSTTDAGGVSVEARSPDNQVHNFRASFLIDASGRGNLTGNLEGLRVIHPNTRNSPSSAISRTSACRRSRSAPTLSSSGCRTNGSGSFRFRRKKRAWAW